MGEKGFKKILIFDTNFIIEHINDLKNIIKRLSIDYDIFITEISVEERLSKKYLELKKTYEKIDQFKGNYSKYININIKKGIKDQHELDRKNILDNYKSQFGEKIIPFNPSEEILRKIIERVYKKAPPFLDTDNASDKGFKDTLIWISMLDFFKSEREKINLYYNKVLFLTNDKGFRNYASILENEFFTYTDVKIEIVDNSYYAKLVDEKSIGKEEETGNESIAVEHEKIIPPHIIKELRKEISDVINRLCYTEDLSGDVPTFFTHKMVEVDFVENAFMAMENTLKEHLLESDIYPSEIWNKASYIEDNYSIPTENVQRAVDLYHNIRKEYGEYITQFYNAVCKIINSNYREKEESNESLF
jgi:hypothetical protein